MAKGTATLSRGAGRTPAPLERLPVEVVLSVSSYLTVPDCRNLRLVSKFCNSCTDLRLWGSLEVFIEVNKPQRKGESPLEARMTGRRLTAKRKMTSLKKIDRSVGIPMQFANWVTVVATFHCQKSGAYRKEVASSIQYLKENCSNVTDFRLKLIQTFSERAKFEPNRKYFRQVEHELMAMFPEARLHLEVDDCCGAFDQDDFGDALDARLELASEDNQGIEHLRLHVSDPVDFSWCDCFNFEGVSNFSLVVSNPNHLSHEAAEQVASAVNILEIDVDVEPIRRGGRYVDVVRDMYMVEEWQWDESQTHNAMNTFEPVQVEFPKLIGIEIRCPQEVEQLPFKMLKPEYGPDLLRLIPNCQPFFVSLVGLTTFENATSFIRRFTRLEEVALETNLFTGTSTAQSDLPEVLKLNVSRASVRVIEPQWEKLSAFDTLKRNQALRQLYLDLGAKFHDQWHRANMASMLRQILSVCENISLITVYCMANDVGRLTLNDVAKQLGAALVEDIHQGSWSLWLHSSGGTECTVQFIDLRAHDTNILASRFTLLNSL